MGHPAIIAHRGASLEHPDNNWPAFRAALKDGADGGWAARPAYVRSANRHGGYADRRDSAYGGLRVARTIGRDHVAGR